MAVGWAGTHWSSSFSNQPADICRIKVKLWKLLEFFFIFPIYPQDRNFSSIGGFLKKYQPEHIPVSSLQTQNPKINETTKHPDSTKQWFW